MSVTSVEVKNSAYNRNISKLHEFGVIKAKETPKTPLGSDYEFDGCFLPLTFVKHADRFKNFKVREDDVWIISYPKTGTTWTIEMAWILMNELDYENTTKISPSYRIPYLEYIIFLFFLQLNIIEIFFIIKDLEQFFQLILIQLN